MAKVKDKKPQEGKQQKEKLRRLAVKLSTREVMVGMEIVTSTNREGYVVSTTPIRKLETGPGCLNLHVNDTTCYDRSQPIPIAFPEEEALGLLTGLKDMTDVEWDNVLMEDGQ
jgi:hypothetical protein